VFDEMSPPKFDSYLSQGENEIVGDLPIYQEGMNVDQIFDYFTIMDQVLSSRSKEKEEHISLLSPTFGKVLGDEIEYGEPLYDIKLEDNISRISREQFQVCEPTIIGSKPSLKLQQNRKSIYIDLIWAFIEDKIHGFRHRARLREMLGVSLLLGDAPNYDHNILHLVSNYNGRCR
ncbi:hypothetical protein MKX03_034427, partial [Papaver bracteatum]